MSSARMPSAVERKSFDRRGQGRRLTAEEFYELADVPPEFEWFANIDNAKTKRAYEADVRDFLAFVSVVKTEQIRLVTRPHVIAWRRVLEGRKLSASSIRRKLSALSSLFQYLCEANVVSHNPVDGVRRPNEGTNEGKTPAIGDRQARALLNAPDASTLKGKRDRAILAVFLYHGLRSEEVCRLRVRDFQDRSGVKHLRVHGKRNKIRYVPVHPAAMERIAAYLDLAGHTADRAGALFRSVRNPVGMAGKPLTTSAIYYCVVKKYATAAGIDVDGFCVHSLRTTAATNALDHTADIAFVQQWLGHASIATTQLYDKRKLRPKDSPTFKVTY